MRSAVLRRLRCRNARLIVERILGEQSFDFFYSVAAPLTNPRAETYDVAIPSFGIHVLGPKGPGAALGGSAFVYDAAFSIEKEAVFFRRLEVDPTLRRFTVSAREGSGAKLHVLGQTSTVFQGEVDKTVTSPRRTTLARSLALESQTRGPKGGVFFLH